MSRSRHLCLVGGATLLLLWVSAFFWWLRANPQPRVSLDFSEVKGLSLDHKGSLSSLAFSPDSKKLFTTGRSKFVSVWDTTTGREIKRFEGSSKEIHSSALSPDGGMLALGGWDRSVTLWNTNNADRIGILKKHTGAVTSVAFDPNGKLLISGGGPGDGRLIVWDVVKLEPKMSVEAHESSVGVSALAINRKGSVIATAGADNTTRIWDIDTGKLICQVGGHTSEHGEDGVTCVALSPCGEIFATGGPDCSVKLWDMRGKERQVLRRHKRGVTGLAFSPSGTLMVSVSGEGHKSPGEIIVWNVQEMREVILIASPRNPLCCVAFAPDGQQLALGSECGLVRVLLVENILKSVR